MADTISFTVPKSGKKFVIKELSALESSDAMALATPMTALHAMMAKAIVSIDDAPAPVIKNAAELRAFLNKFSQSDLNYIRLKYDKAFELSEEDLKNALGDEQEQPDS